MNYKITSTNVIISLLILVSMSLLCHLNRLISYINQKSEKFGELNNGILNNNDPNKIYSRESCSHCLTENKKFSRLYHQALDSAEQLPCPNSYKDPCPDVLKPHAKVPEDIKSKCNTDVSNVKGLISGEKSEPAIVGESISQEEFDDLLLKYVILTSKRTPTYPWYRG